MADVTDISVQILVVEDNPGDVKLFLNEFKEINFLAEFHVVTNGVEALQFLYKEDKYVNMPRPDLLVLDLYLPKKDGIEVLSEMSKDKHLIDIPVVIFSSSEQTDILENCQRLQHIFINKPKKLEDYKNILKTVENFWLNSKKK